MAKDQFAAVRRASDIGTCPLTDILQGSPAAGRHNAAMKARMHHRHIVTRMTAVAATAPL